MLVNLETSSHIYTLNCQSLLCCVVSVVVVNISAQGVCISWAGGG